MTDEGGKLGGWTGLASNPGPGRERWAENSERLNYPTSTGQYSTPSIGVGGLGVGVPRCRSSGEGLELKLCRKKWGMNG